MRVPLIVSDMNMSDVYIYAYFMVFSALKFTQMNINRY